MYCLQCSIMCLAVNVKRTLPYHKPTHIASQVCRHSLEHGQGALQKGCMAGRACMSCPTVGRSFSFVLLLSVRFARGRRAEHADARSEASFDLLQLMSTVNSWCQDGSDQTAQRQHETELRVARPNTDRLPSYRCRSLVRSGRLATKPAVARSPDRGLSGSAS